ncbi:MAG: hypothetical protein ACF8AM_20575 [Rhodopirellula sp. JB055]|uniref:hypothetical protein n=1 Tax=Rhodopirellula sp. JB055 TaxID=3342846 RepID=UPI00370A0704
MIPKHSPVLALLAITILALSSGCTQPKELDVDLHPVHGKLTLDGQPAAGATIKFIPVKGSHAPNNKYRRIPAASVGENGEFELSFDGIGDGAPLGEYKLVAFKLQAPEGGGLPFDHFRGKYLDENNPITTITIVEGDNDLGSIELSSR